MLTWKIQTRKSNRIKIGKYFVVVASNTILSWKSWAGDSTRTYFGPKSDKKKDNLVGLAKKMQSNFNNVDTFHIIVELNIIIN